MSQKQREPNLFGDRTRKNSKKIQQIHMHPEDAYEFAVACLHTPKNQNTPEKGKMAVF
ncbi:hypothetical protein LOC54_01175 [Acetobacter sp. AN02]|uniref:hypothetical protein n=1 Tax=Acetobacter sp. AN02 TaxID=2894186 RepID=UPI0024344291|nr:hypothetical protein [Acetobacter sp. AN02]MDG6093735.1 hypothetical protein [Acetobacter sp. AN02]